MAFGNDPMALEGLESKQGIRAKG